MLPLRSLVSFMPFIAAFACSSSVSQAPSSAPAAGGDSDAAVPIGASSDDAGPVKSPSPPPPCPEGTKENGDACTTKLTMVASPQSIAPVRDHHTTHVIEVGGAPYLYVLGGTNSWQQTYDDIQRAKINADGSLGAFEPAGTMRMRRAGHVTALLKNGKVLVVGGSVMSGTHMFIDKTSDIGTLQPDGTIGDWKPGPSLPVNVMHSTIELKGDYITLFGGRGGPHAEAVDMVAQAKIGDDGTPGEFAQLPALPDTRSHHMSFQYGDYVYLAGGITGDGMNDPPSRKDIIRATLGADGALGAWEKAGSMLPSGLCVSAATVYGRQVFFLGGLPTGGLMSSRIVAIPIAADGSLGNAKALPTELTNARGHVHQTPMWGKYIYSVGGKSDGPNGEESIGAAEIGTFSVP